MKFGLNKSKEHITPSETTMQDSQRLYITSEMKQNLLEAAKWTRFLNIVVIVGCVFRGIRDIITIFTGVNTFHSTGNQSIIWTGIFGFVGLLIIIPLIKNVSSAIIAARCACNKNDNESLGVFFRSIRFCAKYLGVLCFVSLCLIPIVFLSYF